MFAWLISLSLLAPTGEIFGDIRSGETYLAEVPVVLTCGGEKVEAAMLSAGYRSKRSFYRDFRTRLGATPGVYRDNLRRC